jgi:hypothetical protein
VTPFCEAVVEILKASHRGGMGAGELRRALIAKGWGKHPAAVAMHLTKLAWKGEYITCYCQGAYHVFMLTPKGNE